MPHANDNAPAPAAPTTPSLLGRVLANLVLPKTVTNFEQTYLERMNRIALVFFLCHVPLMALLAAVNDMGIVSSALLAAAVAAIPLIASRVIETERGKSMVFGFTAMSMGAVLVHVGQGPVQIEMHFYFFSLLAMLALFANPMVIIVAAATVAVQHLALWALAPSSVFNYDAPIWVVLVHAAFVVLETVAACFIARNFFDNVIGLEKKVEERTREVEARNRDLKLVLDNVHQGLATVDADGTMVGGRSAAMDTWFGVPEDGATLASHLGGRDEELGSWLELSWESLTDGFMPLEVCLDQMPRRAHFDERHYELDYQPILDDAGELSKLLVIVSDITSRVAFEAAERRSQESLAMFRRILSERQTFTGFFSEATRLLDEVKAALPADVAAARRPLHTLKGNASLFELRSVAALCHDLEDALEGEQASVEAMEQLELLTDRWEELSAMLEQLVEGSLNEASVTIPGSEYDAILEMAIEGADTADIAAALTAAAMEPTDARLAVIAEQARTLAERLEKGAIEVEVNGNGLRLDEARFRDFWSSFSHVVRNAVDHGLESPGEREATGKSPAGRVRIETIATDDEFIIELTDDGRGIDWERVDAKARELGLIQGSDEEPSREALFDALFSAGLTTAEAVTNTSGRGVGLEAVRTACQDLGGHIDIETEPGEYTTFRFVFPMSAAVGSAPLQGRKAA